jgi:Carboxypeptidase regulatory-like domain
MVWRTATKRYTFAGFATTILALIVLGQCLVLAQTSTATISGVVRDTSGALIPGVSVIVKHIESGSTRTAVSNETGNYRLPLLPVGPYEISTDMPGFKPQVRRGVNLSVAQEAVVDLTLEVGGATEQVTVIEEAPLVNTTLNATSGLITQQQVKDLPLNGRSFDQLLTLNTGISNNSSNVGQGNGWTGFSVAGKRQETNRFMINGVDWLGGNSTGQYITPSGASGQLLGVEAVREYNVLEHTYGAEYGKRGGGQITVVTSSGTNQWHGDVFEYLRNSALDARNFFDQTIGAPPFKRNQFGGALGGPLKKDKMFVFGNYEGFRQRLALSSRAIVPDLQARQGLLPCNVITPTPSSCESGYAPVPNLKQGMLPYANDFWPTPNGPEVLTNGLPSGTAYNYNNALQSAWEDFGLGRFDYTISGKDSLFANYTKDDGQRDTPRRNPNFINVEALHSQTLGLTETHIFSNSVVNTATMGYARTFATLVRNPTVKIAESLLFLPGGNPGSIVIGGGATTVAPAAIDPAEGINPVRGIREYYTWSDDLRSTHGKHSLSMGGWLQRIHQNESGAAQFSAGGVSYSTMLTFLQDIPGQFNLNRNPLPLGYRSFEAAWYIQDEIKLRRNLTMRLGLRDEMTDGWSEVAGRCSNYRFDQNFVISTNPVIAKSCLQTNHAKALWQPRVGFAWDVTGTGRFAVRAGFGIHNDLQDNLANRTYANPPFNAREQLTGSLLSLIPLQKNAALPPTCGPTQPQPCSIYSPAGVDPNLFTPTHQQWSLTVDSGISKDLMLSVGYVGSQSYHTPLSVNANSALPQVCQDPQGCISGGTTTGGAPVPVTQRAMVPQGTLYHPPATRPNPYVGNGVTWFDEGTSSYHSLNVSLVKRTTHGLTFKTNYTYSKVIDLNSAILAPSAMNEPPDVFSPYHLNLNRGVASYSLNHQFNGSFSYQLPFGNGQRFGSGASGGLDKLIGGWQWNGIVTVQDGFPFTPLAGSNTSGTGDANQSDVPNWNPDFHGKVILGKPDQWYDPRAFLLPTQGTFGNVARGSLRGPGLIQFDTSLFKRIRIREGLNLQFRTEAFNVFNHANFSYPGQVVFTGSSYSSSAGVISQTATTSRQIQFAMKLLF